MKESMPKVSAIIPSYNEEKTISLVVNEMLKCPLISEVICINDASKDNTLKILKSFGDKIILIDIPENKGKGNAIAEGLLKATKDWVLFCDADFTNLNQEYLKNILAPLVSSNTEGVIGHITLPDNKKKSAFNTILDRWSGTRVYKRKDLLPFIEEMRPTKYGLETFLNKIHKNKKIVKVNLEGLDHLIKYQKSQPADATIAYAKEGVHVAKQYIKNILPEKEDS